MKKLSNTEAELKKSVAYKKKACNAFETAGVWCIVGLKVTSATKQ